MLKSLRHFVVLFAAWLPVFVALVAHGGIIGGAGG